ncbi:MAG: helix-turn-helix domain-containing protein [Pseudomonadaceae bacterium]|jgi:DNA-binding IclR family transcriptional regulator
MTDNTRKSESGGRVLDVLLALNGHVSKGLTNGQLAKGLGESAATINRCINTLIDKGLVKKNEDGSFSQTVRMAQIGLACLDELDRETRRLEELRQRVRTGY